MGCHVLYDPEQRIAALYCSTSDSAFGPIFTGLGDLEAHEVAQGFLKWNGDPRSQTSSALENAVSEYLAQDPIRCAECDEVATKRSACMGHNPAYVYGYCSPECKREHDELDADYQAGKAEHFAELNRDADAFIERSRRGL